MITRSCLPPWRRSASLLPSPAPPAMRPTHAQVGTMAQARDDVDVYNNPVEPRAAYDNYFIKQGTQGKVLARHEDGWCKLDGVAPGGG